MNDTLQEIFATLRRSKLRTTLTGISVSTGMFLLIVLLGAGNGIINAFKSTSDAMTLDVMQVFGGTTSKPFAGLKEGRSITLDKRDLNITSRSFSRNVTAAMGVATQDNVNISPTGRRPDGRRQAITRTLTGTTPEYRDMNRQTKALAAGRFINIIDMRERRKVAVISQKDANELFGSWRKAPGRFVCCGGATFKVTGVYPTMSMSQNQDVYVPLTTLQTVYGKSSRFSYLLLKTKGIHSDADVDSFAAKYRKKASPLHLFSPLDADAVWMWNTTTGAEQSAKAMRILRTSLWIIGLLTLTSGIVGISNIMLITVRERTHEFGIRKALGARPRAILRSVMAESIVITTAFGYLGMLLGLIATEYLNAVSGNSKIDLGAGWEMCVFLNPTVTLATCLEALAVMVAAGVAAGLVPAAKAVKVKPIEALRAE